MSSGGGAERLGVESAARSSERLRAFGLSWFGYASYYLGRKGFSVVKSSLSRQFGLDPAALALVDSVYLLAYALGQLPSGLLVDRWGSRRVVAAGLLLSAAACALFGGGASLFAFSAWFGLNGLAQATGWPGTTKIVAQWTEPATRGRTMGAWATCYQVGGMAATALASWLLGHFGWRAAFYVPAAWLALTALLVFSWLPRERAARSGGTDPEPSDAPTSARLRGGTGPEPSDAARLRADAAPSGQPSDAAPAARLRADAAPSGQPSDAPTSARLRADAAPSGQPSEAPTSARLRADAAPSGQPSEAPTSARLRVRPAAEAAGRARPQPSAAGALALRTPALYAYGACYFCIKLIRYSLLFWLPYYLHTAAGFDEVQSGYLSIAFEVGGVAGSVGVGYASDRLPGSRARVAAISLAGLALALYLYAGVGLHSALWHFSLLAAVGALLFGPDALVSGAAAQEAAGPRAAATAVGLVNGLGSAGALLQGALTIGVQRAAGWDGVFYSFVGLALAAAACLLPNLRARASALA